MSWSLESTFVRSYAKAAVGVQVVLDALKKAEKLTRPTRRTGGFDEDAAGEYLDEPISKGPFIPEVDVHLVGFTSCSQDMESYAEGFNEGFAEAQRQQDPDWQPDDDTPNPTEPGLDDCELIGVRGLLQERYGDQSERVDTQDAQMWRAFVSGDPPKWLHDLLVATGEWVADARRLRGGSPELQCGHRYCEKQGYGLCFGVHAAMVDFSEDTKTSPAASAAGDSPSDACDIPPSPSEGRPRVACTKDPECERAGGLCENVRECGNAYPDDAAAEWIGGAVPVISAVLAAHNATKDALERVVCRSQSGGTIAVFSDWQEWRDHVSPLIANALAPQPKPAFPETGLDMGARLDGASAMYPQHTRHQK